MFGRRPLSEEEFERLAVFAQSSGDCDQDSSSYGNRAARISPRGGEPLSRWEEIKLQDNLKTLSVRVEHHSVYGRSNRWRHRLDGLHPWRHWNRQGIGGESDSQLEPAEKPTRWCGSTAERSLPVWSRANSSAMRRDRSPERVQRRIGRFGWRTAGRSFLDEVGELPLDAQVKLLRC